MSCYFNYNIDMVTATLGGLIKDYRIKKRLSQIDLSLRLGWKDASRISRIEQGRIGKPNRQTAERIVNALVLNEQERGDFLLVGGYLPTDNEVQNILKEVKQKIDTWVYPAYLADFTFRWLYTNTQMLFVRDIPSDQKKSIEKNKPNFIIYPFLPKDQQPVEIRKGEDKGSLIPYQLAQVIEFKNRNEKYQNESWYKKLIKKLMQYDDFRTLWPKVDENTQKRKLFDYEYKELTGIYNGKKLTLQFHSSIQKVIIDPRFEVVLYFPANRETDKLFTK